MIDEQLRINILDRLSIGYLADCIDAHQDRQRNLARTLDKRINIRLSGRDLSAIQRKSLEEGVPCQTLVASVLHKYVSGSLYDVTANKAH